MSNKIFDIVDGKLIIKPEALAIQPFSTIWESDKSKDKTEAYNKIKVIWFNTDLESPFYKNYPEETRLKVIALDVLKDKTYKPSKDVLDGISKYKELYTTPEMRLIEGAHIAVNRMEQYYRNVNFESDDIKKVNDSIIALPKLAQALKDARKIAESSEESGTKVRGNASLGMYE